MNAPQRVEFAEPATDQLDPMAAYKPGAIAHMPERPLTVIEQAIKTGATAEQLERILDLQVRADNHKLDLMREQRRMAAEDRAEAARLSFFKALAKLRGKNIIIPKGKYVDRGKAGSFWHAEFDAVCSLLSPALSECGFSFRHKVTFGSKPWTTEGVTSDVPWVYVTRFLDHEGGHTESESLEGPPGDRDANTPVQNMQTTATVLKRQTLVAITGTATGGEDDEGQLRKQAKAEERGASELEALRLEGNDKAMSGMEPLLAWWGKLSSGNRKDLGPDFPGWRRAAQKADETGRASK